MTKNIDLLYEISSFRYVERTWRQFLGLDFANNAEHSFCVAWIALMIASMEKVEINHEKILKFALLHDLAESRTGDLNYISRQYAKRDEDLAVKDIFKDTLLEKEMLMLWDEYEKKESIEARIVKDADTLNVDIEIKEQLSKGSDMVKSFVEIRKKVKQSLYTKSAKKLFDQIYKSNPHSWHLNGRNRLLGGDWKHLNKK